MTRLRRSRPQQPGWTRRRRGSGWQYLDERNRTITSPAERERIETLAIPPAWRQVWICPWPNGHLQATGTDDAGRRQYLYHADWSASRERQKYLRITGFASALPSAREQWAQDLQGRGLTRNRVLAATAAMLDAGYFRIGSPAYAEQHGSVGLITLQRRHVRRDGAGWRFRFVAKSGIRRTEHVDDPALNRVIATLMRRRGAPATLFCYRRSGRATPLAPVELNDYLKSTLGDAYSAKDFRTWHGTVLAAVVLAEITLDDPDAQHGRTAAARASRQAVAEVAEQLGNTVAVCRRSYIDPRVFDAFAGGRTITAAVRRGRRTVGDEANSLSSISRLASVERAVLTLLGR